MTKKLLLLMIVVCLMNIQIFAQRRTNGHLKSKTLAAVLDAENSNKLPIRRVILYSNGVAYIERRGIVSGNAEISFSFKQSQVDDVLKSMVVLDLNQGRIGAVSYNSSAPPSARMAEIPFSVSPETRETGGIAGVLSQLQGARISVVSTKGAATGSILTVEKREVKTEKSTTTTTFLVIASESGEISSFDLGDVRSVKLLDEGTRRDVNEFANATASARRRDAKTITVTSQGAGQREMIVSYTIAAPIWKTTYRVVLDENGKPFFQGWAIVDNVSDEDWQNVQLSLVSGTPISFIQPIQKPFYRYRPVIPIPEDLKLAPQVYEEGTNYGSDAISGSVYDANDALIPNASVNITNTTTGQQFSLQTNNYGSFSQTGLPAGNYTLTINAPGFQRTVVRDVQAGANLKLNLEVGTVSSTVEVTASSVQQPQNGARSNYSQYMQVQGLVSNNIMINTADTSVSTALISENAGVVTAATGEEIGDLFEYRIEQPITVLRDRSALIPIVQTKMDGERISIYNESVRRDRPMGGMLLKNVTNLTLESGSLTVLDRDAYAGEALMERLKPKEQRLISFALDLGTIVTVREKEDREPAKLIKIASGVFQVHYFRSNEKIYQISNQTDRAKTLFIEHPVKQGMTLSEKTPKPDITTQKYYRFRIELKPFEKTEITVGERQPLMDSYQLSSISRNDLALFITRRYIDEATRAKLEKLIDLRIRIAQTETKLEAFEEEVEKISDDQKRLRENIEALSKTPEAKTLITRYIEKVNNQESRLEQIEKERQNLEAEKQKLENEFAVLIRDFQFEDSQ